MYIVTSLQQLVHNIISAILSGKNVTKSMLSFSLVCLLFGQKYFLLYNGEDFFPTFPALVT